jgi:hypothetical protein
MSIINKSRCHWVAWLALHTWDPATARRLNKDTTRRSKHMQCEINNETALTSKEVVASEHARQLSETPRQRTLL